jgi:hypothetical protein
MSFFSSLVANVTSGVANLGLSSRRFSLSRQDSNEANVADGGVKVPATPSITVSSSGNLSTPHGKLYLGFYLHVISLLSHHFTIDNLYFFRFLSSSILPMSSCSCYHSYITHIISWNCSSSSISVMFTSTFHIIFLIQFLFLPSFYAPRLMNSYAYQNMLDV